MTSEGAPTVFSRIVTRVRLGLWKERGVIAIALVLVVAVGMFVFIRSGGHGQPNSGGDCADAALAVETNHDPAILHAAWECMSTRERASIDEDFFTQFLTRKPLSQSVSRVYTYADAKGTIADFIVIESDGTATNWAVYLDTHGLVSHVE